MTAHDHTEVVSGCFRCELGRDELGVRPPTPLDRTAYEPCSHCGGSGMQDYMNGPGDCSECRGDCYVRARDERGRFTTRPLAAAAEWGR